MTAMISPSYPIIEPSLIELLKRFKIEIFKDLNCAVPGTVQSFNLSKGTAVVKAAFKSYAPDGSIMDSPILLDCPVFSVQGGGGAFLPPVSAADPCVVVFSDQHLDAWFQSGTPQLPQPQDDRMHDLSDGMAFVGFNSANAALAWVSNTFRWTYGGAIVDLTAAGLIRMKNGSQSLATLIQSLFTTLEGASISGGAFSGATITALQNLATQFAGLLTP